MPYWLFSGIMLPMRHLRPLLLVGASACAMLAADVRVIDEIIAKVNGEIITRSDVDKARKQAEAELRQRGVTGAELDQALQQRQSDLLREKIDQSLLVQKAREVNINVDGEVQKYLADLQLQAKIAEPEKFQQYVREQTGLPFEDYKAEVRNSLLTQRVVRQEVGGRITVPRTEMQKFYEDNKQKFMREERVFLREVLVSTEGKDAAGIAAAEKKARDLTARARRGEKFNEMVRDNSDAVTKAQGGDLGSFKRGELDPKIEQIVFNLDRNSVTDPIRVQNGFLILRVDERHKPGQATFEESENEIMDALFTPRMQPAMREYLTKLRQEAFLEIRDGYVDSGAAPGKSTKWSDPAQLRPETVTKEEVANQPRRRRFLGMLPIPGTSTTPGTAAPTTTSPVDIPQSGVSVSPKLPPK